MSSTVSSLKLTQFLIAYTPSNLLKVSNPFHECLVQQETWASEYKHMHICTSMLILESVLINSLKWYHSYHSDIYMNVCYVNTKYTNLKWLTELLRFQLGSSVYPEANKWKKSVGKITKFHPVWRILVVKKKCRLSVKNDKEVKCCAKFSRNILRRMTLKHAFCL